MLFNSEAFLFFFPTVVILYYLIPHRWRWLLLLLSSYVFYMWWEVSYILLIWLSTLADYYSGLKMGSLPDKQQRKKYLYLSLFVNLGMLGVFKYFNFFSGNVNTLAESFGSNWQLEYSELLLPVGISFYTFQTLSYSIEVYRGNVKPEKHLGKFALYVAFFPQLVAGPIERAQRFLPQLQEKVRLNTQRIKTGLRLITWGLFKKVVIGDRLAYYIEPVFDNSTEYQGWQIVIAACGFAFRVYCDFSGYSDIAIGAARIFGYDLMQNFRQPFHAHSMREFWRRWHISLSTWFKDYVYIPLGGNRVTRWRWYYNLIIVFVAVGFWHGANWTFICFGLLHAVYILLESWLQPLNELFEKVTGLKKLPRLNYTRKVIQTFILFSFSFVFYRANNVSDSFILMGQIFPLQGSQLDIPLYTDHLPDIVIAILALILMQVVHHIQEKGSFSQWFDPKPHWFRWACYVLIVWIILNFGIFEEKQFIYFQF